MPLPKAVQDLLCRCRGRRSRSPSPDATSPGAGAELTVEYSSQTPASTVPDVTTTVTFQTTASTVPDVTTAAIPKTPVCTVSDSDKAEFLDAWFPDLQKRSYLIPTEHFRTVHAYDKKRGSRGGYMKLKDEKEINKPGQYDNNYDRAAKNVMALEDILARLHKSMNVIRKKSPNDVMVMMTQTNSSIYKSVYAGAADFNNNTESSTVGKRLEELKRKLTSDLTIDLADLVVVERDRGVLIGAVVRNNGADLDHFWCELSSAIDYLNQARDIVEQYVVSAVEGGGQVPVHATLLLPNLARRNFEYAAAKWFKKELKDCLRVHEQSDVYRHCLCYDEIIDSQRLMQWWKTCRGEKVPMEKNVYRDLVYRFAVPLLTVKLFLGTEPRLQLWHKGQVVHALGEEFGRDWTRLALFPEQARVLEEFPEDEEDDDDVILLHGPPGTSKTFMLMLRASHWLKHYQPVVAIAQTKKYSWVASSLIKHQLEKVAEKVGGGSVQMLDMTGVDVDIKGKVYRGEEKLDAGVEDVCRGAVGGAVHLLADEAHANMVGVIYSKLKKRGVVVRMWAAGIVMEEIPDNLKEKVRVLREPLRCPRAVTEEIQQSGYIKDGVVPGYTEPSVARAHHGLPTVVIEVDGLRVDHEEAGRAVGKHLVNTLRVGMGDRQGLRYKDVFVLGASYGDTDFFAVARGLEAEGVPACPGPVRDEDSEEIAAWKDWAEGLATGGREDAVTVTRFMTVNGLERPVVVWLDAYEKGSYETDMAGRLHAMSRSTAHLIIVRAKEKNDKKKGR